MIKKAIYLFFSLSIIQLLTSCPGDCPPIPERRYEYKDIEIENIFFNKTNITFTNDTVIPKLAYGINLKIKSLFFTSNSYFSNPFCFQSAHAFSDGCEPDDTIYIAKNKIMDISIYTLDSFDIDHPEGSKVNKLFRLLTKNYSYHDIVSKDELGNSIVSQSPYFNENYLLMFPPKHSSVFRFKVVVKFSDSLEIEKITKPVLLN
jgi:hypothetical protein